MTQIQGCSTRQLTTAALAACWFAATPAAADETTPGTLPAGDAKTPIFLTADSAIAPDAWYSSQHFHFAKKAGFGYTRHLKFGEHALSIGVRGPVMPRQKALGLNFRIRF